MKEVSREILLGFWKVHILHHAGEAPLHDFPDGTLARREVAAFLLSEATGWAIVPPTVLRDGPFGEGAVQAWLETDPAVDVFEECRTPLAEKAAEERQRCAVELH